MGENVTLKKMIYNLLFRQEAAAAAPFSSKVSFLSQFST
jgi:hypothetical protein